MNSKKKTVSVVCLLVVGFTIMKATTRITVDPIFIQESMGACVLMFD